MAEEKSKVVDRVVSRLTTLRMELDSEERAVLDAIVIGERAEVTGHAVSIDVMGRVTFDQEKNTYRVVD